MFAPSQRAVSSEPNKVLLDKDGTDKLNYRHLKQLHAIYADICLVRWCVKIKYCGYNLESEVYWVRSIRAGFIRLRKTCV